MCAVYTGCVRSVRVCACIVSLGAPIRVRVPVPFSKRLKSQESSLEVGTVSPPLKGNSVGPFGVFETRESTKRGIRVYLFCWGSWAD